MTVQNVLKNGKSFSVLVERESKKQKQQKKKKFVLMILFDFAHLDN